MALPATNASTNALSYSTISLVPLRVNVVSDDKAVTIVDTIVLDRNCWPTPLFEPLEESIQRNADQLAYTLLSDMEVHGMGRTVRHFTGRVDVWSASLQDKIKAQLIPQLRHVAKTTKFKVVKLKAQVLLLPNDKDGSVSDNNGGKKRNATTDDSKGSEDGTNHKEQEATDSAAEDSSPPVKRKKTTKSSLVPVRLRLCVNGVRIHDDFIWDLSVPQCPIEFAQSLGRDLNLCQEAVVAIVTSIVEQLDGSAVEDTKDLEGSSAAATKKNATAAWHMENRVHLTNMGQLLARHRPT